MKILTAILILLSATLIPSVALAGKAHLNILGFEFTLSDVPAIHSAEARVGGHYSEGVVERRASDFEEQIRRQFNTRSFKLPRLPFRLGAFVDSLVKSNGILVLEIEGSF